jgi:hypothetical protein
MPGAKQIHIKGHPGIYVHVAVTTDDSHMRWLEVSNSAVKHPAET